MADNRQKHLRIKTGVLKRIDKEKKMYEKEVVDQQAKVDKMIAEKKDEYDIRKQKEVLQESKDMIPDCERRLKSAFGDLQLMIESAEDLQETEEYINAKTQLDSVVLDDDQ